jgi:hypothetical protein
MPQTPALERAVHPLTLAAASLALLNDLVLRPLWPASWWTGKLSTFAAAFALPLLLAAVFSILLRRRQKLAAGLAFGLVLLALVLLKATPQSNHWLTAWLPVRAVPDPSDLLAVFPWLAALIFSARPAHFARPLRAPNARLLFLPLAAFFLLADAAQPDYGAACLQVQDHSLLTRSTRQTYLSTDGGRTWEVTPEQSMPDCYSTQLDGPFELAAPDGTSYRVTPGGAVERSAPGGGWETVYNASSISEPERVYNLRTISSNLFFQSGPLDALIDPVGSSLVLAMGTEGVLIVPPAGDPLWSAVGAYRHNSLRSAGLSAYLVVLGGEIWLSAALALALLATAALRLRRAAWQIVLTTLGWLLLAAAAIAQHPEINTSYRATFSALGLLLACIWALVLALIALFRLRGERLRAFAPRILFLPLGFAAFLLPYIAWAAGLLPSYWLALVITAFLAAALGFFALRPSGPPPAR